MPGLIAANEEQHNSTHVMTLEKGSFRLGTCPPLSALMFDISSLTLVHRKFSCREWHEETVA